MKEWQNHNEQRDGLPPPCRLVHVLDRPAGFSMAAHTHDYYQVICVTAGSLQILTAAGMHTVRAEQAIILAPGAVHALASAGGYSQIGIDLQENPDEHGIRQLWGQTFPAPVTLLAIPAAPVSTRQIVNQIRDLTGLSRLTLANMAEQLLLHILTCAARADNPTFPERFLAMMGTAESSRLRLPDMCRHLRLSKTQLERQVQATFHCGAVEYVNRLRLSRACLLLQTTDLTTRAIGLELGFYDESHFQSFFRRRLGMPPGRYRTIERTRLPEPPPAL